MQPIFESLWSAGEKAKYHLVLHKWNTTVSPSLKQVDKQKIFTMDYQTFEWICQIITPSVL